MLSVIMLSFDEALAEVLQAAPKMPSEVVALADANGRILAENIRATASLPPQDYSAMDGYAVAVSALDGDPPWTLRVTAESRTGRVAPRLDRGTACRIFTGAAIPEGADAVVMQEDVVRDGDDVRLDARPALGAHVRRAGEDLASGDIALAMGARLDAFALGLLAAVDRATVTVAKRPRVTILATGDELRPPGSAPRPASIPESNGVAIAALASSAGASVDRHEPSRDDPDETKRRFARAIEGCDLLVTIGGVSVGDYDVVRPALEAAGVALAFHKVAMKPGKPLTLGRRGDTIVLGLPGNPVSAQVTFSLFGLPLLRKMQGAARVVPTPRTVRLASSLKQKPGRRGFYAATLEGDVATPLGGQSSGATTSLAWADALVVVPEDSPGLDAGATAKAFVLRDL